MLVCDRIYCTTSILTSKGIVSGMIARLLLFSVLFAFLGCERPVAQPRGAVSAVVKEQVISQGQIMPQGGIVKLSVTPGDVVEQVDVRVGDRVTAKQVLLQMRSQQASDAQLKTLTKRREAAAMQREQAIAVAERQLSASQLRLEHLAAQRAAVERKRELLELAQQQVKQSEQVLQSLESMSRNVSTSEFVGRLDIQRQKIALGETQLTYRQQAEGQRQAEEELTWAERLAAEELAGAEQVLANARASQALEILDLEMQALVQQSEASKVVAPMEGVILAVNVVAGEAGLPHPLIEMADLTALVCEIEVNEMDAPLVKAGQPATITSRALGDQKLRGHVVKKFSLIGRPQLRSLDPLARADFRTVTALIALDESSTKIAQDWVQLQVEAAINVTSQTPAPAAKRTSESP